MHFTTQSKKSAGALTLNQIIFAFVLLIIVLVGQASALPAPFAVGHAPETGHQGEQ